MDDCCQQTPLFTFGVIADIQYADIDDGFNYSKTVKRYYRSSLELLRNARESWSESAVKPQFILQLGDIIDGFNKEHNASQQALDSVLREFSSSPMEVHHVWGNHEFYNFSRSVLLRSKLNSTLHVDRSFTGAQAGGEIYAYHFSPFPGFRFVVLDAYDVSLLGREESSEQYATALKLIKLYNSNEDLNCPPVRWSLEPRFTKFNGGFSKDQLDWLDSVLSSADGKGEKVTIVIRWSLEPRFTKFNGGFSKDQLDWLDSVLSSADGKGEKVTIVIRWSLEPRFTKFNGGFSKDQLDWLDSVLSSADGKGEKVTIVSHLPVHPDSTDPICLAWNHDELLDIIRSHFSVVCFMAGHDHDGGYTRDKQTGVHHLTLEGVIETPPCSNAFGTVSVYEDRMVLKGKGRITDRVFLFP